MDRTPVAVGCLVLALLAGGAHAQEKSEKGSYDEAGPGTGARSSLPTKRLYDGGMQNRLFPSGFERISIPSAHGGGMNVHRTSKGTGPRMVFARSPLEPTGPRKVEGLLINSPRLSDVITKEKLQEWREGMKLWDGKSKQYRERRGLLDELEQQGIDRDRLINVPPRPCTSGNCGKPVPPPIEFKSSQPNGTVTQDAPRAVAANHSPSAESSQPGRALMRAGETLSVNLGADCAAACASLREHLSTNRDDFRAHRHLALAELSLALPKDAARTMAAAYAADPLLASEPIALDALGLDVTTARHLATLAQSTAMKANTSDAWLLLLVVRQAQGKNSQALAACDKAEKAGLDSSLVTVFRQTLAK